MKSLNVSMLPTLESPMPALSEQALREKSMVDMSTGWSTCSAIAA
jgi:hypothetical protein